MKKIREEPNKNVFLPLCSRCGDILNISIDPMTFEVSYNCSNEDLSKIASYSHFEKKYMKSINSLKDELKNSTALPKYLFDEKEKNYNNILKYFYEFEKCKEHNLDNTEYCPICKHNICIFCANEEKHIYHKDQIIKYRDIVPSNNQCEKIIQELINREKFIESFICKIEEWKKIVMKKIETLKQKLNEEIILLRKIVINYNKKFLDVNYINNFQKIYQYLSQNNKLINVEKNFFENKPLYCTNEINHSFYNDKNIYLFYNENNICEKTKYLINLLDFKDDNKNEKIIYNNGDKEQIFPINSGKILFLDNEYIINVDEDKVYIYYYFKNTLNFVSSIQLNDKINHLSTSSYDNNKIICTSSKKIFFLGYDLKKNNISLLNTITMDNIKYCSEIKRNNISLLNTINNIKYCSEIKRNNLLVINNYDIVIIFVNNNQITKKIINNNLLLSESIFPVNEDYFISIYNSSIYFYDVNTLQEIKMLNIGYSPIITFIGKEYITQICRGIIFLINIKTKELVQIINFDDKQYNNIIYISYFPYMSNENYFFFGSGQFILLFKYNYENKYFDEESIKVKDFGQVSLDNIFKFSLLSDF